ncbi:MAG: ABC transporter permease subunit [Armatimonadota bacterium]|nr:ABC transporter permease subunit [Armatimonadota bacterium]MDR7426114.1 ABC transporter permease subunit [Armatimonadota bacterium]MDR7463530.1 ABC transporter permease subunit [Armatimonadota bacterium]MDR7469113.1 ABC transporter permease subunit [Armatimonadota bacterium]MDR7475359.1 ABC transporter permease subunit [Armatimonadota bacterium]
MITSPGAKVPPWRDVRKLEVAAQVLFIFLLALAVWGARLEVGRSFIRQNIHLDWSFWRQPASFQLTALTWTVDLETLRPKLYDPGDSAGEAMIAGLFNTVKVAVLGVVLATLLGLFVGIARLSRNWLVSRLALAFVELFRNTPLLVQLFFWYFAVFLQLPSGAPGQPPIRLFADLVVLTNAGLALGGTVVERFGRLTVDGGVQLTTEFAALLVGLAVYTSAFIAEIIRGGILAVSRGQMEAARSLGLTHGQALRLIVLPQALRIVIPPLGNQFLNLTKNSSLALGIGYAEFLTAANTVSSQSFRSLEAFTAVTLGYLVLSLIISGLLNLVRARLHLAPV